MNVDSRCLPVTACQSARTIRVLQRDREEKTEHLPQHSYLGERREEGEREDDESEELHCE